MQQPLLVSKIPTTTLQLVSVSVLDSGAELTVLFSQRCISILTATVLEPAQLVSLLPSVLNASAMRLLGSSSTASRVSSERLVLVPTTPVLRLSRVLFAQCNRVACGLVLSTGVLDPGGEPTSRASNLPMVLLSRGFFQRHSSPSSNRFCCLGFIDSVHLGNEKERCALNVAAESQLI